MAKDNKGIKSLLSLHSPRVVVAKKPRPSVQEMLEHEDLLNIYDPFWWIPDTPVETPEDTSKATLEKKEKKERTDKKYRYARAMEWITRPPSPYDKATKKKIVDKHYKYEPWYNRKVERITKPTEDEKENKDFWAGYNDPSGKKMVSHINTMTKKYSVTPQTPEREQKVRVNNTTREKPDGQV